MQTALIVLNVILLAAALLLAWHLARVRGQRKQRGMLGRWPVRKVRIEEVDPAFRVDELGPTPDAEVRFIGRGSIAVPGGTSDAEAWILSQGEVERYYTSVGGWEGGEINTGNIFVTLKEPKGARSATAAESRFRSRSSWPCFVTR